MKKVLRWFVLLLLVTSIAATVLMGKQLIKRYGTRVLPGVSIAGVDVGDMTIADMQYALIEKLPTLDEHILVVTAGNTEGVFTWPDCGISYDLNPAISTALAQSTRMTDKDILLIALGLKDYAFDIAVDYSPPDAALVQANALMLAQHVYTDPQDAFIYWGESAPEAVYGVAGQRLDIPWTNEAMFITLENAIASREKRATLDITPLPIEPVMPEPEPAYFRAMRLLDEPFRLHIYDPILLDGETEAYSTTFTADPARLYSWMYGHTVSPNIYLNFNIYYIQQWIMEINERLPEGRYLGVRDTAHDILSGPLQRGENDFDVQVNHWGSTYTVQPADVFYDIAFLHGFPQYQLEVANPDAEPRHIDVGQELTIPSLDVLFPHPHAGGKNIQIHLPTQTLTAYEYDIPIYTFTVSSGISTTPTISGQFQVLFKEDNAYAKRWHLDMPYFMGFYEEGPQYFNGFHELPITEWGTRLRSSVLGYPASFGCIILNQGDAQALYEWADVGTYVRVIGFAPDTPTGKETLADIAPIEGVQGD